MDVLNLLVVLLFHVLCIDANPARRRMRWTDCTAASSPLRLTNLNIQPSPITLPGSLNFSMRGYSNRTIGSSQLQLRIKRLGSWMDIRVPCLYNIGSCDYLDLCTMLDKMIDENWLGATRDVGKDIKAMLLRNNLNPGLCPQPPTQINIRQNRLRLPTMPSVLTWFAEGLYKANVKVIENTPSAEVLLCVDVYLYVEQYEPEPEPCTGWFCFG